MRRRVAAALGVAVLAGGAGVATALLSGIDGPASAGSPAVRGASAAGPSLGGCRILPADNPWNTPVDAAAPASNSARMVARLSGSLHADFGENPDYGIPFVVVPAGQAEVPITYDAYGDESDPGPFPVPLDAPVEAGGDRHVLVVRQGTCELFELYAARRGGSGWTAASGARFDLSSNALRPDGWTSADAAGLPILPGLARCDEIAAGRIDHALRVTFSSTRAAHLPPATHHASSDPDPDLPAMGQRLRLRSDVDISAFHGQARILLDAMRRYGLIVADNGSNWFVSGAPGACWDDGDLDQLKSVPGTWFEVVA